MCCDDIWQTLHSTMKCVKLAKSKECISFRRVLERGRGKRKTIINMQYQFHSTFDLRHLRRKQYVVIISYDSVRMTCRRYDACVSCVSGTGNIHTSFVFLSWPCNRVALWQHAVVKDEDCVHLLRIPFLPESTSKIWLLCSENAIPIVWKMFNVNNVRRTLELVVACGRERTIYMNLNMLKLNINRCIPPQKLYSEWNKILIVCHSQRNNHSLIFLSHVVVIDWAIVLMALWCASLRQHHVGVTHPHTHNRMPMRILRWIAFIPQQ